MTLTPKGGAAIPVSVTTTRRVQGGAAIPVYGYMTAPTDGRPAMGGSAIPVRVLTAADLKQNGGQWTLEGRPHAMPVYTAPAGATVMGGPALAVYPVNAWPTVPVVPAIPSTLLNGLQVWYELSEAGTGARNDSHTNALHLTNNGGATQGAGIGGVGYATVTDGTKYLSRANHAALQTGNIDFTLAVWVKPAAVGTYVVAAKGTGGEYTIAMDASNNQWRFVIWESGVPQLIQSGIVAVAGTWYLIMAWVDTIANTANIQIDNNAPVSVPKTKTIAAGAADFAIGAYPAPSFYLAGSYAKFGYWKRVLTVTERATLYSGGAGVSPYPFLNAPANLGLLTATTVNVTVSGDATRILIPSSYQSGTARPLVIYHHGAGEDQTAVSASDKRGIIDTLLLNNYIVCAGNFGGDNWGNDAALTAVTNLYNYMTANYSISRVVFLSQSAGGPSGLLSIGGSVPMKGWAGIFPVCNLANMFGGNAGASAPNIRAAYGIAGDGSDYAAKTAGHDPVLVAAATFDNIRMRFYASASDTTVTKADNSDQMATLVTGHATEHDVVVCTGDHGDVSHFQPSDVLAFFNRCV